MKKIIVITGMDGVGKSTLIKQLLVEFPNMKKISIWDPMSRGLFESKQAIDNYLCSLTPNARVQFLSHAMYESLETGLNSACDTLLIDAYYYKYFASELALGASQKLIANLSTIYPIPNLVIQLELDITTACERKKKYSKYECGLKDPKAENFIAFQKLVVENWMLFKNDNWLQIAGSKTKEEIVEIARNKINEL